MRRLSEGSRLRVIRGGVLGCPAPDQHGQCPHGGGLLLTGKRLRLQAHHPHPMLKAAARERDHRVLIQPNSLSVNWITELQDSSSSAESQDIGRGQSRTSRKQTSGSRKPSGAFRPLGRQHARSGTGPSERGVLGPAAESGRDRFGRRERRALAGSYRSRQASGDVVSAASAMRRAVSVRRAAYDESIQPCTPR